MDEGIWLAEPESKPANNNSVGSTSGVTSATEPSFSALLDQVAQNNLWSAEQAQRQMDFQRQMYERSLDYNSHEAEINRDFQQDSADRAMAFSSAEAVANRQWQEMMSNTAHQREMLDLQKAGLNPILAANNGASAGTGATASSAQAAGHAASSSGSPSGAKGDGDQSGTMAIVSLLGKMLDNQIAREQMENSAEIAYSQADMYTAATRYAAELAMIASEYSADRHAAASEYGSDRSYQAAMNDMDSTMMSIFNGILQGATGSRDSTDFGRTVGSNLGRIHDYGVSIADFFGLPRGSNSSGNLEYIWRNRNDLGSMAAQDVIDSNSYTRFLSHIDTGGRGGNTNIGRNIVNDLVSRVRNLFKKK